MYDIYENPRHLNIKKVIVILIILIVFFTAITLFIAYKISLSKNDSKDEITEVQLPTTTIFKSQDNSISVELSNALNLKSYNSDLGYLLELHSENDLNIFISKEDIIQNKTLSEIIEADKIAFLQNFEGHSNLSETTELIVNNNQAYTYSFHYLDKNLNKVFYLQVIWLQIENSLYIFDVDFPLNDLTFNSNTVTSLLASFNIN